MHNDRQLDWRDIFQALVEPEISTGNRPRLYLFAMSVSLAILIEHLKSEEKHGRQKDNLRGVRDRG